MAAKKVVKKSSTGQPTTSDARFDLYELYDSDPVRETEGVDVQLGPSAGMRVARIGNDNYYRVLIEKTEAHAEALSQETPEAKALDDELMLEVLAETVLLNFWGFYWKGEPVEYSKDNAIKFLRLKHFRRRVMAEASKASHFHSNEEADIKN